MNQKHSSSIASFFYSIIHLFHFKIKIDVKNWREKCVIGLPYFWLGLFFVVPFLIIFKISFSTAIISLPPYSDLFKTIEEFTFQIQINFENYFFLITNDLFAFTYWNSLKIAFIGSLLTLAIGYPFAYALTKMPSKLQPFLILLIILPFLMPFLLRLYAWIGLLQSHGLINDLLIFFGIFKERTSFLHRDFAVYIGIAYCYLPFMVLPIYTTFLKIDENLIEAASDLGAKPFQIFWHVILPLSMPGVLTGFMLVFIPAMGEYIIPELLGGADTLMIGKLIWNEFFSSGDWPLASAIAIALLCILVIPIMIFQYYENKTAKVISEELQDE